MNKVLFLIVTVVVTFFSSSQNNYSNNFKATTLDSIVILDINLFSEDELAEIAKLNTSVLNNDIILDQDKTETNDQAAGLELDSLKEWLWSHPTWFIFPKYLFESFPEQLQADYLFTERVVVYQGPALHYHDVEHIP